MRTYGKRIKFLRISHGLTLEELAKKIGSTKSNVSKWERNLVTPNPDSIKKLATVLNVEITEIADLSDRDTLAEVINQLPPNLKALCKSFNQLDGKSQNFILKAIRSQIEDSKNKQ